MAEHEDSVKDIEFKTEQDQVIFELLDGNRKYVKWLADHFNDKDVDNTDKLTLAKLKQVSYLQQVEEDRLGSDGGSLRPVKAKALTISCARSFSPMDHVFSTDSRSLMSVRVSGYTCSAADSVIGSVEFELEKAPPPVLLVVGNRNNDVVSTALRKLIMADPKLKVKVPPLEFESSHLEEIIEGHLMDLVIPAAHDALEQYPNGTFEDLVDVACRLNVFRTMESLLTYSEVVNNLANAGTIRVVGAFFDSKTGAVQMLGTHPSQVALLKKKVSGDIVRTAHDQPVPAEEAVTMLYSGNRRFADGRHGLAQLATKDKSLLAQLSTQGQNPVSVIIGCADSRAPIEILFDMRPGDLFVLRNAGNTCSSSTGSLVGSAEYSITHLRTKLMVVTGHTKCGAVTAAVDAVRNNTDLSTAPGSIGLLLADIHEAAKRAVADLPNGTIAEQVALGTKYNIFNTIKKLIASSEIVYTGVKVDELQIHGAVYDIFSGEIEWLGEHPNLYELIERESPLHKWRGSVHHMSIGHVEPENLNLSKAGRDAVQMMVDGNQRFVSGKWHYRSPRADALPPVAIVLGGSECRVPIEDLFDVEPGKLIVQRVLGSVAGNQERTAYCSIEYALGRWSPPVLVVLMYSNSPILEAALLQLQGQILPRPPIRVVLDHLMVSTMRAVQQAKEIASKKKLTAAGEETLLRSLATELNCLYSMEMLLKSKVVRDKVSSGQVQLIGGIMDSGTGKVRFIGEHPRQSDIINAAELRDRVYHNGMTSTIPRGRWVTPFEVGGVRANTP